MSVLLTALAALLLSLAAPSAAPAAAPAASSGAAIPAARAVVPRQSGDLTLTVINRICPVSYLGPDFATDCASPGANLEFTLSRFPDTGTITTQDAIAAGAMTATTDAAGAAVFAGLTSGRYELRGGPPGEFVENAILCHATADPAQLLPVFAQDNQTIHLGLIETDLTCAWYSAPEDLRGDA